VPGSLILGYGNLLRGDDGIGWKAAAAMEAEFSSEHLVVITAHQLMPEMAETVSHFSRVLFLDAAHTGQPGEIRKQTLSRSTESRLPGFTHEFSPPVLLALAYRLYAAEPEAALLTLTGENFDLQEGFSAPIEAAWAAYLAQVREWIKYSSSIT
jgi:hydrogenase maturation protease